MRKQVTALLLVVSALVLSGCQRAPMLHILNNTGRIIEIIHVSNDQDPWTSELDRGWLPLPFLIWRGQGRDVTWSTQYGARILIGVGACRALYEFPQLSETLHGNYFVVRLDADLSMVLVDPNYSSFVSDDFPSLRTPLPGQTSGFPKHPVDVSGCPWNPNPEPAFSSPNDGS